MDKKTTAQVAKALGITRSKIHQLLYYYPSLRPSERVGKLTHYLWSADEIEALRVHFILHRRRER